MSYGQQCSKCKMKLKYKFVKSAKSRTGEKMIPIYTPKGGEPFESKKTPDCVSVEKPIKATKPGRKRRAA